MARVALLTDTHFGSRNDSRAFTKYFGSFYKEIFFPYLKEHNIERIIHLGDLFDRRRYINFQTLSDARKDFFEPLRDYDVDLIVGNHCVHYKNTLEVNSPDLLLRDYPNIKVHTTPVEIDANGVKLALLPWVCSDNYIESMKFLTDTKSQLLFGHLEIAGFEMHAGSVSDTGFDENLFKKFDMVFTGHFHHKSTRGNINYLGAPYEMTWSDYGDERGFHIFDTDTRELTFVRNPYSIFHKIFYDDSDRERQEASIADTDFSYLNSAFVKVVVKERNDPFLFDRLVDKIEAQQPQDVTFIDNTIDMMFQEDIDDEDIEDTAAIITAMVSSVPKQIIQQPLLSLMLELHKEAINQSSTL